MTAPKRIQLRRTRGWRKPEGAVVVSRPSKWGNPFAVGGIATVLAYAPGSATEGEQTTRVVVYPAEAVELFRAWAVLKGPQWRAAVRSDLAGRDLCCWCPLDQPCHADVLLEIANGGQS